MPEWMLSEGIESTDELVDIITCCDSVSVLAGAGAGKTELLAQKANYLFFTDKCAWPKRILSLTFKTEAQANIKERINKRCGNKSTRFDSFTFHAFSKSIVDRFKNILPEKERPENNYDIVRNHREANGKNKISMDDLVMLAIRILRANEDIKKIFPHSYAFVFIDEFQDTTDEQYELLKLLFINSDTKILTVGDINQSIMLWAGARKTVFSDFIHDFSAQSKFLVKNYRASNEIQNVLHIILNFVQNYSSLNSPIITNIPENCSLHKFKDEYQEASFITQDIDNTVKNGVNPSDICVLTKQLSHQYTEVLRSALTKAGINNLDMTDLQDALKEPLGQLFSQFLKALVCPCPKVMTALFKINLELNNTQINEDKEEKLTSELIKFLSQKKNLITTSTTVDDLLAYIKSFIHELGIQKIKGKWPQYKSIIYYNHVWSVLENHLRNMIIQTNSLEDAAKLFNAENAVHLMNIHKCKGLEYHSVYFVGLEDQAFWKYKTQTFEDNCAIYVALSRAKNRICVSVSNRREHRIKAQYDNRDSSINDVKPIIHLLRNNCKFVTTNHTK